MNLNTKIVLVFTIVIAVSIGVLVAVDQSDPDNSSTTFGFFQDDTKMMVDANNQFALDFYSELAAQNDSSDNIFFSPVSISTAFAILYEGADGNTSSEMQDIFGFEEDDSKRRESFASMMQSLNPQDEQYKLRLANALWLAKGFTPLPEYTNTAETYYDSKAESLDFLSGNAVDTINNWTSEKTEGKIEKLFDSLNSGTKMVITNAIYFKGTWIHQFDPERTKDRQFWLTEEESVMVPTMDLPRTYLNYFREIDGMQVLELPYKGDGVSMLVLLPERIDGLNELEKSLTIQKISQWKNNMENIHIAVSLPKFTMETDYDLKKFLPAMGITDVFNPANSDLGGISGEKGLFVDQAIHKAFVDVNEEGTEAAAATGMAMLQSGFSFRASHPFLFIIQDNNTDQILFMGRVMDPTK